MRMLVVVAVVAFSAAAEEPAKKDVKELSLEDLLETPIAVASPTAARSTRESPGVVTAMTREEIVASGARDLLEVLQLIAGFSFHTDVEGVVGAGFRGLWGHEGKVLLIVDGIEMNELLYSTVPFGNRFPVQIIERVEVIRGPGSAIYGGNAGLAVINVITRGAKELRGFEIGGRYAQSIRGLSDRSIAVSGGYSFESIGLDVAANIALGHGRRGHGRYEDFSGQSFEMGDIAALDPAVINLDLKWKGLQLRFLYDDYRIGSQDGYGPVIATPATVRFRTLGADLRYRFSLWDRVKPTAYAQWRLTTPWEVTDEASELHYRKSATRVKAGAMVEATPLDGLELTAGVEGWGDFAWLDSDVIVGTQTDFGGRSSVSYANVAAYAQAQWDNPYVNVSAGGRYEWNSQVGSNFAPRIALGKRIERLHLKALYSGAFRSPGIENINLNPGITAERSQVLEAEAGLQFTDFLYGSMNAFYMRLENPIVYGVDPLTSDESYINAGPVATAGYELELQLRGKYGFARATYSLVLPAENAVDTYRVPGRYDALLGFAAHKVTLMGLWRVWRGLQLGGSAVYFSERYGFLTPGPPDSEGNPVGRLGQQPQTLAANVWLGYQGLFLSGLDVSVGVDNLFNAPVAYLQPYDGGHAPLPGGARTFYVRLSYALRGGP